MKEFAESIVRKEVRGQHHSHSNLSTRNIIEKMASDESVVENVTP